MFSSKKKLRKDLSHLWHWIEPLANWSCTTNNGKFDANILCCLNRCESEAISIAGFIGSTRWVSDRWRGFHLKLCFLSFYSAPSDVASDMGRHARRSNHVLMKLCELQSLESNVKHWCKWYQHIAMKRRFYWSTKRNTSWVCCETADQDSIPQSLFSHLAGDMWEGPTNMLRPIPWLATSYNKMVCTLKTENGWAKWATVRNVLVYPSLGCVLGLRFLFRRTHDNAKTLFESSFNSKPNKKISATIMISALCGLMMNNHKVLS